VITPPSSAPPEGQTWTLTDTDANQLYTTTGVYSPGGAYEYSQTTYQLFKGNSVTLNSTNISCTYTPPASSLPCATINADGVVTQLQYDPQGDLISSSTPDGNTAGELATTTYTYDGDGEQLNSVAPDGNITGANIGNYTTTTTTAFNADGEKTSVTQGNGTGYTDTPRTTSYGYDGDGNQTTVTDARGYTTTTTYNPDDESTLVTNPDGDVTLTCYDGDGNITEAVPPVGVAADSLTASSCPTSYPADYNPATKAPLASDATLSAYDAQGDETATYSPAPAGQTGYETTTYTYDGDGNLLITTGPPPASGGSSQVTVDTYNTAGQLASQTTGYGTSAASTASYCYDPRRRQDKRGIRRREHLRDGDLLHVVAVGGDRVGPGGLPDHLRLRLRRTTGIDGDPGEQRVQHADHDHDLRRGGKHADAHRPRRRHHDVDVHAAEQDRDDRLLRIVSALGDLWL
jgi:YD repeat-containing protein